MVLQECDLSFVHDYYYKLHLFKAHRIGLLPDPKNKPIEYVGAKFTNPSVEDCNSEDVISLQDLDVSDDYLTKKEITEKQTMAQLKNYRIPKKNEGGLNGSQSSQESFLDSSGSSDGTSPAIGGLLNLSSPNKNSFDQNTASVHGVPSGSDFMTRKELKARELLSRYFCFPVCFQFF